MPLLLATEGDDQDASVSTGLNIAGSTQIGFPAVSAASSFFIGSGGSSAIVGSWSNLSNAEGTTDQSYATFTS